MDVHEYLTQWIYKIVFEEDKPTRYHMAGELLDSIREYNLVHQQTSLNKELNRAKQQDRKKFDIDK